MNQPIPDTTKPSRVNRKLKRRWKKAKIVDLIKAGLADCYSLANKAQGGLTEFNIVAMLILPSRMTVWFHTRKKKYGAGYASIKAHGFFYTLQKGAGLIRALSFAMAGNIGAASVFAACEPDATRHPSLHTFAGGYSKLKTESPA